MIICLPPVPIYDKHVIVLSHLVFRMILWSRYNYPYFTNSETKTQSWRGCLFAPSIPYQPQLALTVLEVPSPYLIELTLPSSGSSLYFVHAFNIISLHLNWFRLKIDSPVLEYKSLCTKDFSFHLHTLFTCHRNN